MWVYRRLLRVTWSERIINVVILQRLNKTTEILSTIKKRKLEYLGHVMRGEKYRLLQNIVHGKIHGSRGPGRRKTSWLNNLRDCDKPDAYKNSRFYGFSMDLITEIAKEKNLTFEFKITEGGSYDSLMKDLEERRADLGICDFTITPQRRATVDFSMPFMNLGTVTHRT
ncbi:hypothetical protein HUJ05_003406 [Dendroctonus ponderosae]|nr:hypothetical protein HUJ05_003406 [Dendroctonus ponderosae]